MPPEAPQRRPAPEVDYFLGELINARGLVGDGYKKTCSSPVPGHPTEHDNTSIALLLTMVVPPRFDPAAGPHALSPWNQEQLERLVRPAAGGGSIGGVSIDRMIVE